MQLKHVKRDVVAAFAIGFSSLPAAVLVAQDAKPAEYTVSECANCAEWNIPQRPFRVFGNTFYVGPHGLGAILITSSRGHILIDGALPGSAPQIAANIRALGFRVEDVKLILNSHPHFDHAGGIAYLQRVTGATVAASAASAAVLERGSSGPDDPQYGQLLPFPAVRNVRIVQDGETVTVGPIALTAHFTPGHTRGGTTWSWNSCEGDRCFSIVYADSQTPISALSFEFSRNTTYPSVLADFERGFTVLDSLPCDILLTPHPGTSNMWERVAAREKGSEDALAQPGGCKRYVAATRVQLAKRLAGEKKAASDTVPLNKPSSGR